MHNSNLQYAYELIKKKFGESFLNDFISFKERLKKRDEVIAQHIDESVENILLLDKDYAKDLLSFLKELSKTNAFAATFFIEKIPILMHFSLYDDYIEFIAQIKDYNARHISYLLGSYHLMADDLQDILDKVEITYYLSLLSEVKSRSHKLKAVAASVMINSIGIYKSVLQKDLNKYLDLCINIYSQYGFDIAELFLKNTEKVLKSLTLKEVLPTINEVYLYGENYLQLYLMFPEKLPKKLTKTSKQKNVQKKTVLSLLQKDPLKEISKHIELLDNNYLFAIIANWNTFPEEQKNQILEQLRHDDYKKFILNNKYLSNKIKKINSITKNWFSNWHWPTFDFDEKFVYLQAKQTIYSGRNYSVDSKEIQSNLNKIKNSNADPKLGVMKSLQYLKKISSNPENTLTLDSLMESLKNDNLFELIPYLSNKGNLFVNTWARNPWLDYSRSDELFACTSIGDYASSNSPSFLADLNISNLDIWSNGNRIGRIHFYLLKDHDNRPVLLVDRINGSDRLMRHKKRLNELFDCIINYSQFLGFKRIFFNSKISYNNTPKQFVNYLASKNLGRTFLYATRFIEKGGLDITLNTINNSFLEAMESKDFHLIEGFLVNIES